MRQTLATMLSAVVATLVLAADAWAAPDLTVGSFNALHLGWGTSAQTTSKCTQIKALMATVDILLLQETMQLSVPCSGLGTNILTDCSVVMKGGTSYKEAYCAIYNSSKLTFIAYSDAPTGSFSRPPYAILMQDKTSQKYIWFANIHSIFGKKVGPRQNEATAAGTYFVWLMTATYGTIKVPTKGFPVVFVGDWNLPVTNKTDTTYNAGFSWVDPTTGTAGAPSACPRNLATSLTTAGSPSSPYDHIIITGDTLTGDPSCYSTTNALSGKSWRQNVSDHKAIYWGITLK